MSTNIKSANEKIGKFNLKMSSICLTMLLYYNFIFISTVLCSEI